MITAEDLHKAMKRLDIKLSAAALNELVELLEEQLVYLLEAKWIRMLKKLKKKYQAHK